MNDSAVEKRYLTIAEAASYLCVSRWSLYKLVQRRLVPFIPLTTGAVSCGQAAGKAIVRFDIRALDQWMTKKAITPLKNTL